MKAQSAANCPTSDPVNSFLSALETRLLAAFAVEHLGNRVAAGLISVLVGAAVFLAFYGLWRMTRWAMAGVFQRAGQDATTRQFVQTVLKYGLLGIGLITALDAAGIQTSAVLASLGIVGLTIGFAAKDALSNLISSLLIFLDRPFVIGDLVEIDGRYGRVDRITLRSTRIVTADGKMLAVPNTEVINRTVASYTNFPHLRLDVPVNIAVTESLPRVRELLLGLVHQHAGFLATPAPRVVVKALNDYNIEIELQVWLDNEREHVERRFELREQVFTTLTAAGVEMPFETIQLAPLQVQSEHAAVSPPTP